MAHLGVTAERKIAYIASSSHGVVTRAELLGAGLSPDEIRHRAQVGMLIPEYKGVYRVGHQAPSVEARYLAAVRACGDGAAVRGRAAAFLHGIIKGSPPPPEVMTATERRIPRLETRFSRRIDRRDVTTVRGIPV